MTIDTIFNPGDTVWYDKDGKIENGEIFMITASVSKYGKCITYIFKDGSEVVAPVFGSREELVLDCKCKYGIDLEVDNG